MIRSRAIPDPEVEAEEGHQEGHLYFLVGRESECFAMVLYLTTHDLIIISHQSSAGSGHLYTQ